MKKTTFFSLLILLIICIPLVSRSQKNEWVEQVLVGVGGKFETTPPFVDHVRMQSYDPSSQLANYFNTIYTQSVQDILIADGYAYVAAQDSIVKYDLMTMQRVAAVADSGLSRLGIRNNRLIVTKQWPIVRFFVEILNADDLALLDRIQFISGDCGEVISTKDSVYVAVNGGYSGMEGKLAVLDPSSWDLTREINFGAGAVGIFDLYYYDGNIFSINRTGYGGFSGSLTAYNIYSFSHTTYSLNHKLADGIGVLDSLLYLKMDEAIGSFNLNSRTLFDPVVVPDPGSLNHIYITSGAVDYVNEQIYVGISNRTTWGLGVLFSLEGDSLTSFQSGINPDAIALDYRVPVGVEDPKPVSHAIAVYPNPVAGTARVQFFGEGNPVEYSVMDLTGQILEKTAWPGTGKVASLDFGGYPSGLYFIMIRSDRETVSSKFLKK